MAYKEIIIDGVNVSECEYVSTTPSSVICYMKANKCKDNPNCYFKQLQRKTAECEKYEQALNKIEMICKSLRIDDLSYPVDSKVILDIIKSAKDTNVPHKKEGE